ncbi:hypothetical protein NXC12_PE00766 (plasmid) [Rhizobium etli]|uniref:Uncharacterized protein n=1 Tax=Rhizobium etli TaxID=29449 RepID=A0AAN1BN96_RHIET|nr:hypothetical protein REMIM1_PF00241 [Rhizobium etli bv. mimosae str. Mim1]ARQ14359.1 hypothetical protein NXC12_PE00766 [Rhizobium etli]
MIAFLASNDARWTTGQMIDATGGPDLIDPKYAMWREFTISPKDRIPLQSVILSSYAQRCAAIAID